MKALLRKKIELNSTESKEDKRKIERHGRARE